MTGNSSQTLPTEGLPAAMPEPYTAFEWPIYADATFAGLSVLIPIPLLDMVFEEAFRRRMPGAIARRRGRRLAPEVVAALNASGGGCLAACLTLPLQAAWELVKRLLGKLLYFLAVKAAADQTSYYWQQAFLIDYALLAGHLDSAENAVRARAAMERVISASASPLQQLARRAIRGVRGVLPSLRRARQGQEDEAIAAQRAQIAADWGDFSAYLRGLAARYGEAYNQMGETSAPSF